MIRLPAHTQCPCGSQQSYSRCCQQYHEGQAAPTAERLMRARYTAFVVGDADFISVTWAPETRPADLDIPPNGEAFEQLVITDTLRGGMLDSYGEVTFEAHHVTGIQKERSRFERRAGRWVYVDGTLRF